MPDSILPTASISVLPAFTRDGDLPHDRALARTPSPSPSERKALSKDRLTFKEFLETFRDNWKSFLGATVFITLIVLLLAFKEDIVDFFKPTADWLHRTPWAWLIPIVLLILLSFPPLVGHEVVIIIAGFTWGLWIGFGITCAGVFLGEIVTFYILKLFGSKRWQKMKDHNINYETLEQVLHDGGLTMAIIARYSVIPTHLLTAIFSACGMDIWTFCISAFVSLPRPFVIVYLGYSMIPEQEASQERIKDIVKYVALAIKVVITIAAMWYVNRQRSQIKPDIVYQRRKRRQIQLQDMANTTSSTHRTVDVDLEAAHPVAPVPRRPEHTSGLSWSSQESAAKAIL